MNGALHMHMHAVHTPGTLTPCMYLYLPGELSDGGGSHSGSAAPSPMGRNQSGSFSGRSVRLPPRHPSRGGLGGSSGRLSPRLDPLEQAQPEPPPPVPVLPPPAAADAPAVAA